jgi:uncharacterized protein (DUF2141 family)
MNLSPFIMAALAFAVAAPVAAAPCVGNQTANAVKLTVQASNMKNGAGEVAFTVYPDDRRRFMAKGAKLLRARVPASTPVTTACFWLPPGYYAMAQYHDENADHDFNRTLLKPKEGYGFSNDAPAVAALPSFSAARFQLPAGGRTMRMKMRY